ncbi:hypothetical protein IAG41_13890 [Sphingomonas sp. JC676]|uniref:hypothetical protein n=1 Tax=Sphingomonas sp. JC676 TaxID=2768065 RepID=UPI00165789C0|nr:hypothetical protein [Sphingomonas sp. JC676]MBC9033483.1 hypothetical protein [Sphingomonas sp. JC676]
MTGFEFVFGTFSVVLGLAIVEILRGFGRGIKRPGPKRIGWLSPMLGLFLLYDIATFWASAWTARAVVPVTTPAIALGMLITGLYFFAATQLWPEPEDSDGWADGNGWMLAHKRRILFSIFACNALSVAATMRFVPGSWPVASTEAWMLALYFALLLAIAFVRGTRATTLVLALAILEYAADLVMHLPA